MSTAEWNVLGLLLNFAGLLLLIRYGMPGAARAGGRNWLGLASFIVGTLCQIWANLRWIG